MTTLPHQRVNFAHESERDVAAVFDFYDLEWQYEPTTFILCTDDGGRPLSGFTPDFYLPQFDLYIEVTTLQQRLVTRKNRKVRQLHQQHPEVRCKVLYRRDVAALAAQFDLPASRSLLAS
ncbi:MAG: hypothetical protein ACR2QE_01580 [Acidimicrobiales bacterium]